MLQIAMVTVQRCGESNYGGTEERNAPLCQNFITAVITLEHPNECKITEILWHVKCQHIKKLYFNVTLFKTTGSINPSCTKELVKRYGVGDVTQHSHRQETSTRPMKYNTVWGKKKWNVQEQFNLIFRISFLIHY